VVGQELVELDGLAPRYAHLLEGEVERGLVGGEGIQVDRDEDDAVAGRRHLAVEEHVGAVGLVEAQVAVGLERRILPTDRVETPDVIRDVAGARPVPDAYLVLLGARVFLGAGGHRLRLTELEAAVHAPEGGQGSGEGRAHLEGGAAPALEHLGQDVWGIHE
jgi:hypothetical protein